MLQLGAFRAFIGVVLPVFVIVGIGYLARRVLKLDLTPLTKLSLYVLGPSLIFSSLVRTNVSLEEATDLILLTFALTGSLLALSFALASLLGYNRPARNSFMLTTVFGNAGNFGVAMALFAFGQQGLERALIMFVAQSFLLNTIAVYLTTSSHLPPSEALRVIARMPLVYAAIASVIILYFQIELPDPIFLPIQTLGNAAIPVLILTLGMQLVDTPLLEDTSRVALSSAGRLLISPAVALALTILFGLPGLSAKVAILSAAMPTAVSTVVLAIEFRAEPRFVSTVVMATTIASAVTITVLLTLLM